MRSICAGSTFGPMPTLPMTCPAASEDSAAQESADDKTQRLESDARAVQISTIHSAKGLEYPIVLLPFGWGSEEHKTDGPLTWIQL